MSPQTTLGTSDRTGNAELRLAPVAPNPARGTCVFRFALPRDAEVTMSIFDPSGRLVHELARGSRVAGEHRVTWNGRDASGHAVADGVYFVRLASMGRTFTERMVFMR